MSAELERGLARMRARLDAIPAKIKADLQPALDTSVNELADMQRRLVPVDEGDLKSSIEVHPGAHELQRIVKVGGPRAHHARWVEFGTAHTPAQPFFWPAYRALQKRIRARLGRAAGKAIRELPK